jgi:hypothetical protein
MRRPAGAPEEGTGLPVHGCALEAVRAGTQLADQPVLEAVRLAIPDAALAEVLAEAGAQDQRRRRRPARLVVRAGLVDGLQHRVDGRRAGAPAGWRAWHPPVTSALCPARRRRGPRPLVLPPLLDRLLNDLRAELAHARLPPRRDRGKPRVVNRRVSPCNTKRPTPANPPRPLPVTCTIHLDHPRETERYWG